MPTQVIMPQLGESVVEGTVSKWLKQEGDLVEAFEPLLEISTDKVETEIPAPAEGVVLKILVQEGATVERGTLLALIGKAGEVHIPLTPGASPTQAGSEEQSVTPAPLPQSKGEAAETDAAGNYAASNGHAAHITPVVARMAAEYDLDLKQISGTGRGGRVTKKDVEAWLEKQPLTPDPSSARRGGKAGQNEPSADDLPPWEQPGTGDLFKPTVEYGDALAPERAQQPQTARDVVSHTAKNASVPARLHPAERVPDAGEGELMPLTAMRRSIAEHMRRSVDIAPHVTTIFEIDLSAVLAHREANKSSFARQGINLTLTAYFAAGTIHALQTVQILNARWDEGGIFKPYAVNLGIAVSVDDGLLVPVIQHADELSLQGLARAINDAAARARSKSLKMDEMQGGTFTITNHGVGGSLVATPIINQPQSGILGVGVLEKRVKVVTDERGADVIAIRPCCYVSLTFDHRVADGAAGDAFLLALKQRLEGWD
ncbi:MAG: 2-oxo acid dehydrogenase subunit E2 [Anaerolineae bacterium]|nr:2-oxo acid dehydrogenase subunit E2 [Anaerolineae bacterium]